MLAIFALITIAAKVIYLTAPLTSLFFALIALAGLMGFTKAPQTASNKSNTTVVIVRNSNRDIFGNENNWLNGSW